MSIELSLYCFCKTIDQLRLQTMSLHGNDGIPPFYIDASELDQFKKVVDFYFPGDLSTKIGV
eukprot:14951405-Ditylum_brightwellii.AAC.1